MIVLLNVFSHPATEVTALHTKKMHKLNMNDCTTKLLTPSNRSYCTSLPIVITETNYMTIHASQSEWTPIGVLVDLDL